MNLYKKKYLYANGSSITAGGGFEPIEIRSDVRPFYEELGLKLPEAQVECSYPYFIAKTLDLELINEAKSGSGIDRLIRTTLKWIMDNEDKVEHTIFLLEPQAGIRLDWFVSEWDDYGVLNAHKNSEGEYPFTLVKEYFVDDIEEQTQWNKKYKSTIDGYLSSFYDPIRQHASEITRLIMFLELLNSRKIDYLISLPSNNPHELDQQLIKTVPKKSNLYYKFLEELKGEISEDSIGGPTCIWEYARHRELLIYNETKSKDNHIGYYGNRKIAKLIVEYIRHYATIKYMCADSNTLENDILVKDIPIKFVRVHDEKEADFIYLADFDIFNFEHCFRNAGGLPGSGFHEKYKGYDTYLESVERTWPWLKDMNKKNKRFLIRLFHERIFTKTFIHFVDFLEKQYGINKSQLWYIDCNLSEYPCANTIPLEIKLRFFATPGKLFGGTTSETMGDGLGGINLEDYALIENEYRNKKIISLNNKTSPKRQKVFDRILYEYEDHNILKNENIISMREQGGVTVPKNEEWVTKNLKNSIQRYKEINLPWLIDSWSIETQDWDLKKVLLQVIDYHRQCIVSITNETERTIVPMFEFLRDYETIKEIQFSEKCLLPILGGTFAFVVTDGLFYREMEKIGFDFSYLKKLFKIDYRTNTTEENIEEVTKIVSFVKNKSIDELNKFRKEHYHYIKHNKNLLLEIMLGDCRENELKFWETLSNKSLR